MAHAAIVTLSSTSSSTQSLKTAYHALYQIVKFAVLIQHAKPAILDICWIQPAIYATAALCRDAIIVLHQSSARYAVKDII